MAMYSKELVKRAQKQIVKEYGLEANEEQAERYLNLWADFFLKVAAEVALRELPRTDIG